MIYFSRNYLNIIKWTILIILKISTVSEYIWNVIKILHLKNTSGSNGNNFKHVNLIVKEIIFKSIFFFKLVFLKAKKLKYLKTNFKLNNSLESSDHKPESLCPITFTPYYTFPLLLSLSLAYTFSHVNDHILPNLINFWNLTSPRTGKNY